MSPHRLNTPRYVAAGPALAGEGSSSTAGGGVRHVRDSTSAAAPRHGQRRVVESQVEREPAPNTSSGQVSLADPVLLAAPVRMATPVSCVAPVSTDAPTPVKKDKKKTKRQMENERKKKKKEEEKARVKAERKARRQRREALIEKYCADLYCRVLEEKEETSRRWKEDYGEESELDSDHEEAHRAEQAPCYSRTSSDKADDEDEDDDKDYSSSGVYSFGDELDEDDFDD